MATLNTLSLGFAAVNAGWQAYKIVTNPVLSVRGSPIPWHPPQWDSSADMVSISDNINGYFFDAIIRADHNTSRRITEHPVQSGASISDHSYQLPAKLTLEIGMSDAMDSFVKGQWAVAGKSQSAYNKLVELQSSGKPLTITTRLNYYTNMGIESISAPDDKSTTYGLRCSVTFRQIITAAVKQEPVGSRTQVTGSSINAKSPVSLTTVEGAKSVLVKTGAAAAF